jgi:hypothetical protein
MTSKRTRTTSTRNIAPTLPPELEGAVKVARLMLTSANQDQAVQIMEKIYALVCGFDAPTILVALTSYIADSTIKAALEAKKRGQEDHCAMIIHLPCVMLTMLLQTGWEAELQSAENASVETPESS